MDATARTPAHAAPTSAPRPLPPGLELLWGRRSPGARGPRPGLSVDAIVRAAVGIADTEGLAAVSMARVAKAVGFTAMSLYRHVASKDELLALMWNASALGAESLTLDGSTWRERLVSWAVVQRDMIDRHPWITEMPLATPPLAPNSMTFVELGLATLDQTPLPPAEKLRVIGLLSSYTLSEARMAHDAARAAAASASAAAAASASGAPVSGATGSGAATSAVAVSGTRSGDAASPGADGDTSPWTFEGLLRELVDVGRYPRLHAIAWSGVIGDNPSGFDEREEFRLGLETILDGVAAKIARCAPEG